MDEVDSGPSWASRRNKMDEVDSGPSWAFRRNKMDEVDSGPSWASRRSKMDEVDSGPSWASRQNKMDEVDSGPSWASRRVRNKSWSLEPEWQQQQQHQQHVTKYHSEVSYSSHSQESYRVSRSSRSSSTSSGACQSSVDTDSSRSAGAYRSSSDTDLSRSTGAYRSRQYFSRTERKPASINVSSPCQSDFLTQDDLDQVSMVTRRSPQPCIPDKEPTIVPINPAELAMLLKAGLEKYLLIDSRSFLEFNTSHIQQSTNVCCSRLVKRRLERDKVLIRDLLTQTCHIDVDEFDDVIIYDQCTEEARLLSDDTFLIVMLDKLALTFKRVSLLRGGFLAFQAMYPSLCESKTTNYRCAALTSLSQPCLPVSNVGPTRILPFLYLGSQQDALSHDIVQVNEITYVLNVSTTCIKPPHISDGHFLRIPVNDNYSAKLAPYFNEAFQFLDKVREANGCCLVHCLAGISRSPTLAIAYIMNHLSMSSDDAYRYVKDKRPTISPNFNFLGQLLEFEKKLKQEREMNNNRDGTVQRLDGRHWSNYVMDLSSHSPSSPVAKAVRPFMFETSSQGQLAACRQKGTDSKTEKNSSGKCNDGDDRSAVRSDCVVIKHNQVSFKQPGRGVSKSAKPELTLYSQKSPFPCAKESTVRPSVLNLGFETTRRVPTMFSKDGNASLSKSLTDITETSESESPSPSVTVKSQVFTTSSVITESRSIKPLLSPFPCGESTVKPLLSPFPCGESTVKPLLSPFPCGESTIDPVLSPFPCGESTVKPLLSPFPCGESTVKPLLSPFPCGESTVHSFSMDQTRTVSTASTSGITHETTRTKDHASDNTRSSQESGQFKARQALRSSLSESKLSHKTLPSPSTNLSLTFSESVLHASHVKRPQRSSLSLSLTPVTPSRSPAPSITDSGYQTDSAYSDKTGPSTHKMDSKVGISGDIPKSSNIPSPSVLQNNKDDTGCKQPVSSSSFRSASSVTMSHVVKLKSFLLSSSTPSLSVLAQSPTSSLAKLHFNNTDSSDSDNDVVMASSHSRSNSPSQDHIKNKRRACSETSDRLNFYSFPSTSLDKLNFTPCLSNSSESIQSCSASRTSGVKRPLNLDPKEVDLSSVGSLTSSINSSSNNSSVSSPTNAANPPKVVVRKREGRAKRTLVRPNSIAFSSYPTFDLGSEGQDSPNSGSSTTSQDDSSESFIQNGKKSKSSDYMTDVRFRLGRYSEREMYRQITAVMETAMLKTQVYEASRKSRSLDDILSSEDDSSAPNSPKMSRMSVAPTML